MKMTEEKTLQQRIFAQGATIELSNSVIETYHPRRNSIDLERAVAAYKRCGGDSIDRPTIRSGHAFSLVLSNMEDFAFPQPRIDGATPDQTKPGHFKMLGVLAVIALVVLARFAMN
jgi:hypothetical protein